MTSSNGNNFRVTGPCAGNSPVTGEFSSQRPVTRSFDIFFDLRLNKRLSKQLRHRWFETPSCLSWRHCNALLISLKLCWKIDFIQQWCWEWSHQRRIVQQLSSLLYKPCKTKWIIIYEFNCRIILHVEYSGCLFFLLNTSKWGLYKITTPTNSLPKPHRSY